MSNVVNGHRIRPEGGKFWACDRLILFFIFQDTNDESKNVTKAPTMKGQAI